MFRRLFDLFVAAACAAVVLASGVNAMAGSVYSDYVLTTNPVIYWPQNETSGSTASDLATTLGGANNGTYTAHTGHSVTLGQAGPRPSDGFLNMASDNLAPQVDRYGTTMYDSLNTTAGVGLSPYSVQVWFNPTNLLGQPLSYVFTRANSANESGRRDAVYVGGTYTGITARVLALVQTNDAYPSAVPIVRGTQKLWENHWYHLIFVRDDSQPGTKAKVYLNGKLAIESPNAWWNGTGTDTGEYFYAAHRPDYEKNLGINGRYDEVVVWNRALTDQEAWNLFANAVGQKAYATAVLSDDPEAYWRLNETTGTTAFDTTGRHNFTYNDEPSRTGMGLDVGPQPVKYGGFEAGNAAPRLIKSSDINQQNGCIGTVTGVLSGENDYSIEMWFRREQMYDASRSLYLMHRNDVGDPQAKNNAGDYLGIRPVDGKVRLFIFNGDPGGGAPYVSLPGTTEILENVWYHVGMTRQGDLVSVYLNGQLEIQTSMGKQTGTVWTNGYWTFGNRLDMLANWQRFNGSIDEIAIYHGALPQEVFYAHYMAAQVPEPASCVLLLLGGFGLLAWKRFRS